MLLVSILVGLILLLMNVGGQHVIDEDCECEYVDKNKYDFCFRNKAINSTGIKFKCELDVYLNYLKLLGDEVFVPVTQEDLENELVFVTAISQSYVEKGFRLRAKVIVYDLGLSDDSYSKIKELCNVELRRFRFKDYPRVVGNLGEFRWKPLLIAEVLKDHRYFWYADSSVIFKNPGMMKATKMFTCNHTDGKDYPRDLNMQMAYNAPLFYSNILECTKSSMLTYSFSGHGTWAATGDELYKYITPDLDKLKYPYAKMMEAGLLSIIDSERLRKGVLKWWVLCALQSDCMKTRHIRPTCYFDNNNPYTVHAGCHRWDQSVLNVLMSIEYGYMTKNYAAEFTDFFKIDREPPEQPINSTALSCSYN